MEFRLDEKIDADVRSLETCAYSANTFADILGKIQKTIDDPSLHQHSNLQQLATKVDEEVEKRLALRLQAGIEAWTQALEATGRNKNQVGHQTSSEATPVSTVKLGGQPQFCSIVHEIRVINQTICLLPPFPEVRTRIYELMLAWQEIVTSLTRIQSTRCQVSPDRPTQAPTYRDLVTKMPNGQEVLAAAHSAIERLVKKVKDYVDEWFNYQVLWDSPPANLEKTLKKDISLWMRCLSAMEISRHTETRKEFGAVVINCKQLQIQVKLKYDSWHKQVLGQFCALLVNQLKEKPWLSVEAHEVRQQIDNLLSQMEQLPSRLHQYASFVKVFETLQSYGEVNVLVAELRSDALKKRHWKQLMERLGVNWNLSDLTLGQVLDIDLKMNESIIRDVIVLANGEMALEKRLIKISDTWKTYKLDLFYYKKRCHLIRGWDELFNQVMEDINTLAALKRSPFYKVFPKEILAAEDQLCRINALFDVWKTVQSRWLSLEENFRANADVNTLVEVKGQWKTTLEWFSLHRSSVEISPFHSICYTFLNLMKDVSKSPMVMNVLNIPGVQQSLERLADQLRKILVQYLERERASFARFNFVCDEDLLKITSNSKNIPRLQKHFKKMFTGISAVLLNETNDVILGIESSEGEQVRFNTPVSTVEYPTISGWLIQLENEMRVTLAQHLAEAVGEIRQFGFKDGLIDQVDAFMSWCDKYAAQIVVLAAQIMWTEDFEAALQTTEGESRNLVQLVLSQIEATLTVLCNLVLQEQPALRRRKLEHLIIEFAHKQTVTRKRSNLLMSKWLDNTRFYFDPKQTDILKQLSICFAGAKFQYGFEYLGVQERFVQTPSVDKGILRMMQALECGETSSIREKLGKQFDDGCSVLKVFGTGKTAFLKALGHRLGRFVLVLGCDKTIAFQHRIFVGLSQVGGWGCLGDLVYLNCHVLPAISQHLSASLNLMNRPVIPYISMSDDQQMIAQVWLLCQGFRTAKELAQKIVSFFEECAKQLSRQSHYDFGLRARKSVLVSAGNRLQRIREDLQTRGEILIEANLPEQEIVFHSVCETIKPRLVADDINLFSSLLENVFPGMVYTPAELAGLRQQIRKVCVEDCLVCDEKDDEPVSKWMEKVLQLYQISQLHHGLMMVGPSGSGKSSAWRVLFKALERLEGREGITHVINPGAISKDALYGVLDPNTRKWTDGLFTRVLRQIIDNNVRGEANKRQWIVFDGDVHSKWAKILNSVLDDNKLLSLPTGERLFVPPNVRIIFEALELDVTYNSLSNCGTVWFSEDVVPTEIILEHYLARLRHVPLEHGTEDVPEDKKAQELAIQVQRDVANIFQLYFSPDGIVMLALEHAKTHLEHIMDFTRGRALGSFFTMLNQCVRNVLYYNCTHMDLPMQSDQLELYIPKALIYAILWSFAGDGNLKARNDLGEFLRGLTTIPLPPPAVPIIDYEVSIDGDWVPWSSKVASIEVVMNTPDIVVPTLDTVRHESLLCTWLADHKSLVLCGPLGSGKTTWFLSAMRSLPNMEVVCLNFSFTSVTTTPELLLKTFDHYCEYRKTHNGIVLSPVDPDKRLVFFCGHELAKIIDLSYDDNGTQLVIPFLRQMVEQGGFWRPTACGSRGDQQSWVRIERIQFVGACNPPTDFYSKYLSHRLLRHVAIVYVDYPGPTSLKQMCGTLNRSMLRPFPSLRSFADPLAAAMVEIYLLFRERFTQDIQLHYVYYPRDLAYWVQSIREGIQSLKKLPIEGLVRLWAHEALRLFHDRLVDDAERRWANEMIDSVALKHFPNIDQEKALGRPILYSQMLSKNYMPVDRDELRRHVESRLKDFNEKHLKVPLVFFDDLLDQVIRIDRVLRQPQGHLLLIGAPGTGKAILTRFVAWMNGLSVFQEKVHNKFLTANFDEILRQLLRRAGCQDEKICFLLDSTPYFGDLELLEQMKTLLANGEILGLFDGIEFTTLMTQCKEGAKRQGLVLESTEELYKWFTQQVVRNLHVVFTMNQSSPEVFKERLVRTLPFFNRCGVIWFGDWSDSALFQVGKELTNRMDIERPNWVAPDHFPTAFSALPWPPSHRDAIINATVYVHQTLYQASARLVEPDGKEMMITSRHYVDFIHQFVKLRNEKWSHLKNNQDRINVALSKITELEKSTQSSVEEMKKSLQDLTTKREAAVKQLRRKKRVEDVLKKKSPRQLEEIAILRKGIVDDLAQQAAKSIKKQHLVVWATDRVNFLDTNKRIEPPINDLNELERLEKLVDAVRREHEKVTAALKAEIQFIDRKLESVKGEVDLFDLLTEKKKRWEVSNETLRSQMSNIVGDTLLSSAFLSYAGYFGHQERRSMFERWCAHLKAADIHYSPDISLIEYLSDLDERLRWQANGLPASELCMENAIMLGRFIRYPLIMDPSGQATEFIKNEFENRSLERTSFMHDAFLVHLKSAMEIGYPLLVQDAEIYDRNLNPVLNRELRPTDGGRVLVTLGDQDIDISSSFTIFLSTRDSMDTLSQSILSRVTLVNFAVDSLQEKRSHLLKLRGEYQLRLFQLEKSFLQALNDFKGEIQVDSLAVMLLKSLMKEESAIVEKMKETDKVIGEI